jgi:uncharacterized protein YkwD
MSQRTQRLTSSLVLLAILLSTSAFAENRSRGRTDLEKLAAELEARLGPGSVVVERRAPSAPARSNTARSSTAPTAQNAILAAMNRERATRGLGPLRMNEQLSRAAGDRVKDMFAKRYFAHVAPDGLEPFVWAQQRGYRYRIIGENLALGFRGTAVVDGWMRSPGHRDNILQRKFDEVGIAVADGTPQRGYRGPLVVAMYGAR